MTPHRWIRWAAAAGVAGGLLAWGLILHDDPDRGHSASFSLLSGSAFGIVLQRSRLCFASAFRDLFLLRDRRAALGVLAALAVGSVGYQVVFGAWVPDPSAGHTPPTAHIAPASWHLLLGGAAFGLGMVLSGGCISGNLYRLGEGSLTAPTVLAGAVAGFWAGYLAWNPLYVGAVATAPVVWLPSHLGYAGALAAQLALFASLAAVLLRYLPGLPPRPARPTTLEVACRKVLVDGWPAWAGGAAIGALGTFAFLRTRPLGVTSEIGRASRALGSAMGFVPERLDGLDLMAGCRPLDTEHVLSENGIFVLGLVLGSALAALAAGEFRLRLGRPKGHALSLAGGILLGFGAMISLGCTVGTMLSGIMAFSLSGWIFLAGLLGGAWGGSGLLRRLA